MGNRSALITGLIVFAASVASAQTPTEPPAPRVAGVKYLSPDHLPALSKAPKRYVAPTGFAGRDWGALRKEFTRLPEQPAAVRAAWTHGMRIGNELICTGAVTGSTGCSVADFLRAQKPLYRGDGFHILSEYFLETQGYKFSATGVLLHPVVYQFCANWHGMRKKVPEDFDEYNKFCGMRLLFETETSAQLRELPADHVTRYDLVLAELIALYGKPADFTWRGSVTVESVEGPEVFKPTADRRFKSWRWCPAPRDGLMNRCKASIVLSLDPDRGRGIVLFATPALWEYAYAREHSDSGPDPLYTLMHALSQKHRTAYAKHQAELHKAEGEKEAKQTPSPAPSDASGSTATSSP